MGKYIEAEGMTFGQLYDSVASGGRFFDESKRLIFVNSDEILESETSLQGDIVEQIKRGKIYKELIS